VYSAFASLLGVISALPYLRFWPMAGDLVSPSSFRSRFVRRHHAGAAGRHSVPLLAPFCQFGYCRGVRCYYTPLFYFSLRAGSGASYPARAATILCSTCTSLPAVLPFCCTPARDRHIRSGLPPRLPAALAPSAGNAFSLWTAYPVTAVLTRAFVPSPATDVLSTDRPRTLAAHYSTFAILSTCLRGSASPAIRYSTNVYLRVFYSLACADFHALRTAQHPIVRVLPAATAFSRPCVSRCGEPYIHAHNCLRCNAVSPARGPFLFLPHAPAGQR